MIWFCRKSKMRQFSCEVRLVDVLVNCLSLRISNFHSPLKTHNLLFTKIQHTTNQTKPPPVLSLSHLLATFSTYNRKQLLPLVRARSSKRKLRKYHSFPSPHTNLKLISSQYTYSSLSLSLSPDTPTPKKKAFQQ
jgi:hypothetical protein